MPTRDWEKRYETEPIEQMPWFYDGLDADFERGLTLLDATASRVLDLGSGPGTQAIEFARRGFKVVGSDISINALMQADKRALQAGFDILFMQDDITRTRLTPPFQGIFDRGCFHTLEPDQRKNYVHNVHWLLAPNGLLFLKTFSHLEPGEQGPHRFTPQDIRDNFAEDFLILEIDDSVFPGNRKPNPKALFCIMQKQH